MRFFVTALTIILNFAIQTTLFEYIEIFGVQPNTAVILIVSFSILRYEGEGAVIGFFTGLLHDIMFGDVIGLHALLGLFIGYVCGKPFKDFYAENYLLPLFLVIGSTLFYEFSYYITSFLFRNRLDVFFYFSRIIVPVTVYNALLSIPVYRIIYAVNNRILKFENPRRKLF